MESEDGSDQNQDDEDRSRGWVPRAIREILRPLVVWVDWMGKLVIVGSLEPIERLKIVAMLSIVIITFGFYAFAGAQEPRSPGMYLAVGSICILLLVNALRWIKG